MKLKASILSIERQVFFEQIGNRQMVWALLLAFTAFDAMLYSFHGLPDPALKVSSARPPMYIH